ncbi:MAG: class I SAM-dependent methyltransferase, partial [Chloroflexota bacterium]
MNQYTAATYGDHIAEIYDELYAGMFDEEAQVALLAELAGAGRAL